MGVCRALSVRAHPADGQRGRLVRRRRGISVSGCRRTSSPTSQNQAIPPDAERLFAKRMGATTIEVATGHLAMVTHLDETARLIEQAVAAVQP